MTETAKESFPLAQPDRARPVPRTRRKRDHALAAIVVASLAIHATVLLPLLFTGRTGAPPSVETPVEVIQEAPPEPKTEPPKTGTGRTAEQAKADEEKSDQAKAEQDKAKAAEAKAEQARAEQAKADQAKAEQAKQQAKADEAEARKAERQAKKEEQQAKSEQAKSEQARRDRAEAEQAKREKAESEKEKPTDRKVAKQEQARAVAQAKPAESQAQVDSRMRRLLGLPPSSLDPVALPGESADGTEGATYEQLVMSRLTKAVSTDRHPGRPGFATVTFVLGDHGDVVSAVLDRPSGDPILDNEAIEVVRRGAPYPTAPAGAKREFTVTLQSRAAM